MSTEKMGARKSHSTKSTPQSVLEKSITKQNELPPSKKRDSVGEDLIGEAYDELENLDAELNDEGEDDDFFFGNN